MDMVLALLTILVILNIILLVIIVKKNIRTQQQIDIQLLHDLSTNGRALIEIKRVAPSSFFLRTPRG